MRYSISILPDNLGSELEDRIEEAALRTLEAAQAPDGGLTVVISDDDEIQELNRRYREVDQPTDVLAFPNGTVDPEDGILYLGDVIISLPAAERGSMRAEHDLVSELALLVVHGTLHLLGHDHDTPSRKARMWALQQSVLEDLENPIVLDKDYE